MKLLITGGNGFLGKYFMNSGAFESSDTYFCSTTGKDKNIIVAAEYADIEQVIGNTTIDGIIHLASVIPSRFDIEDFSVFEKNTQMMNNLMRLALKKRIKNFIYISTFGSMSHPANNDVKDYYTLSKVAGEHFCSILNDRGISAVSLRISSPFGEFYNKSNVLSLFVDRALENKKIEVYGSGSREQNFIYAGDIVNCVQKCIAENVSGLYSLVYPSSISMFELAKKIKIVTKSNSEIVVGQNLDPLEQCKLPAYSEIPSTSNFGFVPMFSLEEGLNRYIQWRKR